MNSIVFNFRALDEERLEAEALAGFGTFGLGGRDAVLPLADFLVGVGQLKFRGTSVLFRLGRALKEILAEECGSLGRESLGKVCHSGVFLLIGFGKVYEGDEGAIHWSFLLRGLRK